MKTEQQVFMYRLTATTTTPMVTLPKGTDTMRGQGTEVATKDLHASVAGCRILTGAVTSCPPYPHTPFTSRHGRVAIGDKHG
nr:hypothetical protein [Clostridia bacterium]